jgi:carboxyl-terminal processing protease
LITAFKTVGGRTVYDGFGIDPDIKTEDMDLSTLSYTLLTKYLFFNYATEFVMDNPEIASADEFMITDEIYDDFINYLDDKDYHYTTKCEETLEKLKDYAQEEKYFGDIKTEFDALANKLKENKEDDLTDHKDEIKKILRIEIVSRYYFQKGKIISSLADDVDIAKAIGIINEKDSYLAILDGTASEEAENEE